MQSNTFCLAASREEVREELGADPVAVAVMEGTRCALPTAKPVETADALADWADELLQN